MIVPTVAAIILSFFIYPIIASGNVLPAAEAKKEIRIENSGWNFCTDRIQIYVRNVGDSEIILSSVCINGTLDEQATFIPKDLSESQLSLIILSQKYTSKPSQTTIRVVTIDGIVAECTMFPRNFRNSL